MIVHPKATVRLEKRVIGGSPLGAGNRITWKVEKLVYIW